ncbi:transcriptional regulator/sugar kinase [Mesoplasma florum L1]|uniref:Transcriptional regulator/sugar kinase n=1 Tax=Mesoplasma florum (strain ATCC 33453 / NBRC 100688 / NCTC 11704 / L1) TaxID=265311 RepID=Q6F2A4_MESFL|nr:ROK family protein [Mesoplasma florum]AAT75369.1 transcriptional regulator/sugar kinase [Mesoplasma florum L1]
MKYYTFDIGGTSTKYLIFEDKKVIKSGVIEYKEQMKEKGSIRDKITLTKIFDEISVMLENESMDFCLGLSIPGIVDSKNQKILSDSGISETNIDIQDYFKKFKNIIKLSIENDAKSAAYGEFYFGQDQKPINMVHLTFGTGLGCGIIINKEIYRTINHKAGEIGKSYSNINSTESVVVMDTSVIAILIKYKMATGKEISGKEFFELYEKKDPLVQKLMKDWTSAVARTIIGLDYSFDFDLLTIGGGVSDNKIFQKLLFEELDLNKDFEFMGNKLSSNGQTISKVKISNLKNDAGCYGMLAILKQN